MVQTFFSIFEAVSVITRVWYVIDDASDSSCHISDPLDSSSSIFTGSVPLLRLIC